MWDFFFECGGGVLLEGDGQQGIQRESPLLLLLSDSNPLFFIPGKIFLRALKVFALLYIFNRAGLNLY